MICKHNLVIWHLLIHNIHNMQNNIFHNWSYIMMPKHKMIIIWAPGPPMLQGEPWYYLTSRGSCICSSYSLLRFVSECSTSVGFLILLSFLVCLVVIFSLLFIIHWSLISRRRPRAEDFVLRCSHHMDVFLILSFSPLSNIPYSRLFNQNILHIYSSLHSWYDDIIQMYQISTLLV